MLFRSDSGNVRLYFNDTIVAEASDDLFTYVGDWGLSDNITVGSYNITCEYYGSGNYYLINVTKELEVTKSELQMSLISNTWISDNVSLVNVTCELENFVLPGMEDFNLTLYDKGIELISESDSGIISTSRYYETGVHKIHCNSSGGLNYYDATNKSYLYKIGRAHV